MKLFLKDPDVISEMFHWLCGHTVRVVISGTPKVGVLLAAGRMYDTENDTPGFMFRFGDKNEIVDYVNVWEMTWP